MNLIFGTFLFMMVGLATTNAAFGAAMPDDDDKEEITARMTVSGEAELQKPADELSLVVGVVTEARDAETALDDNTEKMEAVVEAVQELGLGSYEYETGRFRVQPKYNQRPRNPQEEWERKIVGYEVTNTLNITTSKLELAGALIQKTNEAGANTIDSIRFQLKDERKHRAEAIAEATKYAREDAQTLADAAGVRLVRVLNINLGHAAAQPRYSMEGATLGARMMSSAAPPPITPGDVDVKANVTIAYEIAPAESGAD